MPASPADRLTGPRNALVVAIEMMTSTFVGLNLTELQVFLIVAEQEGLSVSSVARLCGVSDGTASRTIRRLTPPGGPGALPPQRGLLSLARGGHDNRLHFVFLTPTGLALREALNRLVSDPLRRPLGLES